LWTQDEYDEEQKRARYYEERKKNYDVLSQLLGEAYRIQLPKGSTPPD
jgi:hypothetical protein